MNGSANVNINIKLSDQIPGPAALTDLLGQLKSEIGKFQIPGFPVSDIEKLAGSFTVSLPDTSTWPEIIPGDVTSLLKQFPDVSKLAAPLLDPLSEIQSVISIDFGSERSKIENVINSIPPISSESPEKFLRSLLEIFSRFADEFKDSTALKTAGFILSIFSGGKLKSGSEEFAAIFKQVQAFLQDRIGNFLLAILSISSLGTLTFKIEEAARAVPRFFSLDEIKLQFESLNTAFPQSLSVDLKGLDWNDVGKVDAFRTKLRVAGTAFNEFHSGLVRGLALTEASTAFLNPELLLKRAAVIQQTISSIDTNHLKGLAELIQQALEKFKSSLTLDANLGIDQYKSLLSEGLQFAISEINKLDPGKIQSVIEGFLQFITKPLEQFENLKNEIETIVRDAFQLIQDGIKKVDISPLRNSFEQAMGQLEKQIKELEQVIQKVRQAVEGILNQASSSLGAAKEFILDPQNGLKKKIEDLFQAVIQVFETLNLKGVVDDISASVNVVSQGVIKIEFAPVIDAAVQAMNTIADILKQIGPLLVTDDLRQKLNEATEFLRQIDFEAIRETLVTAFDEILAGIDVEAFAKFKLEYGKVLESIDKIDPSPALEDLQKEVFDPIITELEKFKPADLFQPVQSGFDEAISQVSGFDPTESFRFIEEFFEDLLSKFREISPVKLLEPIEQSLAEARKSIQNFLRLDEINAFLREIQNVVNPFLEKLNIVEFLDALEPAHEMLKKAIQDFDAPSMFSIPASALREFFAKTGIVLNSEGLRRFVEALRSKTTGFQESLHSLSKELEASAADLSRLDIKSFVSQLLPKFTELKGSFQFQGELGPVQLEVLAEIDTLDPMKSLSPLISKAERTKAAVASLIASVQQIVGSLSSVFTSADQLVQSIASLILGPIEVIRGLTSEPLRTIFPGQSFTSVKDWMLYLIDQIKPGQWRSQFESLGAAVVSKLKALFSDIIFNPIQNLFKSIQEKIDLLSLEFLKQAIQKAFDEVEAVIQQFNPAPLLDEIRATYTRISELLNGLNPAAFITEIDRLYNEDVLGVIKAISPKELLLPVLQELFGKIKGFIVSLDIEIIFKPVIDHLHLLRDQLDTGLTDVGVAFDGMLDAIPTGSASVSVSVTVS